MTKTTLSSQAPGLRWRERLRIQLCTPLGPESRVMTLYGTFIILACSMMVNYCFLLLFRFILHTILLVSCNSVVIKSYVVYILQCRLKDSDKVTRQAKVIRTKTIPKKPTPQISQQTFCWLEIPTSDDDIGKFDSVVLDDDEGDGNAKRLNGTGDDDGEDDRDWLHVPCVIAQEFAATDTNPSSIRKGDRLAVTFIDGDTSRPIYPPYQRAVLKRMKIAILRSMVCVVGALLALYFLYDGLPIAFCNSHQLEDTLNAAADWFFKFMRGDDDDTSSESVLLTQACRIPWFVAAGYDVMLLFLMILPFTVVFCIKWNNNQLFEESQADRYHLLRGDEDEEEVSATSVGVTDTSSPGGRRRVVPQGVSSSFAGVVV